MKKYFILMLLSGSIVTMSQSCKKKDDPKTYTCTCVGATGVDPRQNVSEADKTNLHGNSCGDTNSTLAKNVGTWQCQ